MAMVSFPLRVLRLSLQEATHFEQDEQVKQNKRLKRYIFFPGRPKKRISEEKQPKNSLLTQLCLLNVIYFLSILTPHKWYKITQYAHNSNSSY